MKFGYKKFGQYVRPVIPIRVKYNDRSVGYEALVDSGADLCIFDAEIGEALDIDVESGIPQKVIGVAGQSSIYYLHLIEIEVGGWSYEIEAGFLPNVANGFNYGVVGPKGFFDLFIVRFDYAKEEIEVTQRKK